MIILPSNRLFHFTENIIIRILHFFYITLCILVYLHIHAICCCIHILPSSLACKFLGALSTKMAAHCRILQH